MRTAVPACQERALQLVGLCAGMLIMLLIILCLLILDTRPELENSPGVSPEFRGTPNRLLQQIVRPDDHDPAMRQLVLSTRDIETVAVWLLARRQTEGRIQCGTDAPRLVCQLSVRLMAGVPLFLNVAVNLEDTPEATRLVCLRLGRLRLATDWIRTVLEPLARLAGFGHYLRLWEQRVTGLHIRDDSLYLSLLWKDEWLDLAENWVEDWVSRERYLIYRRALRETLAASTHTRFVRLGHLVQALFSLARDRSRLGHPATLENAAVIRALNAHVNGRSRDNDRLQVLLRGRADTARHFLAAAALALAGSGEFSHILGLAKELNDTHGSSGFSFVDLAADRSGLLFAKVATATETTARIIQGLLSQSHDEARFMADTRDLPEHLAMPDFTSPEYSALERLIENRVAALAISGNVTASSP